MPRGKRTTILVAMLTLVVIAALGLVAIRPIREWYYLAKLRDGSLSEREAAAAALGRMRSRAAVKGLLEEWLKEERMNSVWAAALLRIGEPAAVEVTRLVQEGRIDFATCVFLGAFGKAGVPGLVQALKAEEAACRFRALGELREIGSSASEATPAILDALDDPEFGVAIAAAEAIAEIRGMADLAGPRLTSVLFRRKGNREFTGVVLGALHRLGVPFQPILQRGLEDEEPFFRIQIAEVCARGGHHRDRALEVLNDVLAKGDEYARAYAVFVLPKFGEGTLPLVIEALRSDSGLVRLMAFQVIEDLGKAAAAAAGPLAKILVEEEEEENRVVVALKAIGKESVKALFRALKGADEPGARKRLLAAIGAVALESQECYSEARDSLPVLEAIRDDPEEDEAVRAEAIATIKELGG